ncbi:hypothetical protein G6F57_001773 [Rhizopus arrhizus]|uniref:CCZ1/INTU/HSP4 first Longin domain-containing protein n=1 Tax=Rhizopus oryzae TaxID=64495 RepID=A0A9P6XFL3_RHIOR|nr:hypothetical protein G6F23_009091 [Rhizopus arrhizus]KAG1417951.1 hypothetical protein G6F58_005270 [Rhizopus delemar]KAG0770059.1 hypothetical protein G6F24_000542 [Rhizopus arrhizus]KAG0783619.1 hypothetical protein G6F21_010428 [Rhizopus arrhizus]KAG0801743.1 hypothetical protein G6F22_000942 [Rhizopus arrhizus]
MSNQESPSPQLGTSSPMLSYFCVYNPSLSSSEENTKDQILYYTSKKAEPIDVKMKHVGLAQALVNFTFTFPTSQPTQNVHSQKHRMVFLQPEPGFWMHMCIELGILRKQIKDSKGKEKLVTEYLDSQLNNKALEAVLKIGYEQFKLLNGTFSSILNGQEGEPNRQRARALTHAIEELFSEWIWKWDFDRLDIMCFNAVFNGVPVQAVQRSNYLRTNELDEYIRKRFDQLVSHVFVLDGSDGSLVYRSPSLLITDVRSLRKYAIRRVEKQVNAEKRKTSIDLAFAKKDSSKVSGLKSITKTLSNTHFLSYFSSGSKSTESVASTTPTSNSQDSTQNSLPLPSNTPTASSSIQSSLETEINQGMFLTGLVESTAIGMNGEERLVTKADLVRVYLSSTEEGQENQGDDKLTEYYLIIYKHKSNLIWNLLLPVSAESEDLISDPLFYRDLQKYMTEKNLEQLTTTLMEDIETMQEKSFHLGKHYKCFFYDNTTLNMKSTMTSSLKKPSVQITNDMLLQLLEVKEDFEKAPSVTCEVFTRSTSNYWIAGHRVYHTALSSKYNNEQDYTEMYLIAAKKDTSLAEVEETLDKMASNLSEIMHIE